LIYRYIIDILSKYMSKNVFIVLK